MKTSAQAFLAACAGTLIATSGQAADAQRGAQLYENRCGSCHTQSVHSRDPRAARDMIELRGYVLRWSRVVDTGWTPSDIDDVLLHLNERFYKFDCKGTACTKPVRF